MSREEGSRRGKKKPIYVIRDRLMISVFGKMRENGLWPCDFFMLLCKTLQPPTFSFCPANCQRNLMNFWKGWKREGIITEMNFPPLVGKGEGRGRGRGRGMQSSRSLHALTSFYFKTIQTETLTREQPFYLRRQRQTLISLDGLPAS